MIASGLSERKKSALKALLKEAKQFGSGKIASLFVVLYFKNVSRLTRGVLSSA